MIKRALKELIKSAGYEINRYDRFHDKNSIPLDIKDKAFIEIYEKVKAYSTCSIEPMYALYRSIEYIIKNNIPGDLVECGLYKGGSAMLMAYSLIHFKCRNNRKLFLYDTFEGMPEPDTMDIDIFGKQAKELMNDSSKDSGSVWCYSPFEEVRKNLLSTAYPKDNIFLIKGKVEDTIPGTMPATISVLRLDTDWYSSTRHELVHLYPALSNHGVLIIDDYGHWQGAGKATDEYFDEIKSTILLNRIDYTVRVGIKTGNYNV